MRKPRHIREPFSHPHSAQNSGRYPPTVQAHPGSEPHPISGSRHSIPPSPAAPHPPPPQDPIQSKNHAAIPNPDCAAMDDSHSGSPPQLRTHTRPPDYKHNRHMKDTGLGFPDNDAGEVQGQQRQWLHPSAPARRLRNCVSIQSSHDQVLPNLSPPDHDQFEDHPTSGRGLAQLLSTPSMLPKAPTISDAEADWSGTHQRAAASTSGTAGFSVAAGCCSPCQERSISSRLRPFVSGMIFQTKKNCGIRTAAKA